MMTEPEMRIFAERLRVKRAMAPNDRFVTRTKKTSTRTAIGTATVMMTAACIPIRKMKRTIV